MAFYHWQVRGKPPSAPLGPYDCEDVHVWARPIRPLMAEQEESLPLHNLLQLQSTSTAQSDNHKVGSGNNNDCNDNNDHGDVRDSNIIGSVSDPMHGECEKQVPADAKVTPY